MPACPPTPAAIFQRVEPVYPEAARASHDEGSAIVKIEIDASGKVIKTTVQKSAGTPVLDAAATKAARLTTFKPATESCKPVASVYLMVFELRE